MLVLLKGCEGLGMDLTDLTFCYGRLARRCEGTVCQLATVSTAWAALTPVLVRGQSDGLIWLVCSEGTASCAGGLDGIVCFVVRAAKVCNLGPFVALCRVQLLPLLRCET